MKIKYRISDGEVLAWGPMPDLKAAPGEAIETVETEKNLTGMIRQSKGVFREKTGEESENSMSADEKRLAELKAKTDDLTLKELNEYLRLKGIL